MRSIARVIRRIVIVLVAVLIALPVIALGAGWGVMRVTLPSADDESAIPGLDGPVSITLDRHGIPYVRAGSERDAWAAIGWLHARDRMFQMELMRRGAAGRLAELIGAQGLRLDRYVRLLGLAQAAEADLAAQSEETRQALAAYARGVNAWIAEKGRWSAPEFIALGITPEPWRETDSLLWGKVMALFLSGNARTELARLRLSSHLPRERIDELWPRDESNGSPVASLDGFGGHLERVLAALPVFGEDAPVPPTASNIWAVTGSRSSTGLPLLSNDPHLAYAQPIQWHLARVEAPGLTLVGAFAPGVPFLVLGRNADIAWGMTTTHSDTQDVFVERLAGPDSYLAPDGPRPFAYREEVIGVRFGEPVTMRVRTTRHGPVLSDLDPTPGMPNGHVLAVAMTALQPGDGAAGALHRLNRARSFEEAEAAVSGIGAPQQNIVIADRVGRMGMLLPARLPIRRAGDGSFPAPGWDGSHDWTGFAPREALPRFIDPASERIVNANNRVVPDDFPVFLTRDWWGDYRHRRILERLEALPRHDVLSMAAIQMDVESLAARDLLPLMTAARPNPAPGDAEAHALVKAWNGLMAADRPEPLIYTAWVKHTGRRIANAAVGPEQEAFRESSAEFLTFVLTRGQHWCGAGGCLPLLADALSDAVTELRDAHGADMAAWRWGEVHGVRFQHPLMRFVPVIGPWFGTTLPTGGDTHTVKRAGMRLAGPTPYENIHGAGYRGSYDLAVPENSRFIIATGQSGHPLSPHYRDLAEAWGAGGTITIPAEPQGRIGTITLRPRG
ncbi:penicillin acylase family protein [Elioraea rosea]|uniref:penicillin acylase family protein n=1 Tax=Elioraea rosea TaxID=2492390 RepID=UPI001183367B|nr:penicillin acylase family protein [Elioraea rosea]